MNVSKITFDLIDDNICIQLTPELLLKLKDDYFFKYNLKSYVNCISNDKLILKKDIDFQRIENIYDNLKNKFPNAEIVKTITLENFFKEYNNHINELKKIGINIKNFSNDIKNDFNEFCVNLNPLLSRNLRDKQLWNSFFMYTMKKSCNFSVPGSGKTSSVLAVFAILELQKKVKRIIVVGPKNCFESWQNEFKICFKGTKHLNVLIPDSIKTKNDLINELKFNYDSYNLICLNYERLKSCENEIKKIISKETLLVFDEIHRIKKINGNYAKSALFVSELSKYTIALTGTPIPNSYSDIYNILKIILGRNFNVVGFKERMFTSSTINDDEINDKFFPFFCRTSKNQLNVPKPNEDLIIFSNANYIENQIFKIIYSKFKGSPFELFIRILQLESNPKLLLKNINKEDLLNILDDWDEDEKISTNEFKDLSNELYDLVNKYEKSSKKIKLIEVIKKLKFENKKVIIWCIFIDNMFDIKEELEQIGINASLIYGKTNLDNRNEIINRFRKGNVDVLITNPHTLAESISLHDICHDAIYYEYSYNLVHLLQSKDRIHRLGLPDNQYTQWWFLKTIFRINNFDFSIGEKIYKRLCEKENIMLKAIDENHIESVSTSEEDLEIIFSDLRNLSNSN